MSIAENIAGVRERIVAACHRAKRLPEQVTLMGVTKTIAAAQIREAYDAGLRTFGENRVQEFAGKFDALRDLYGAEWHMIGHLQTNKATKAAEIFTCIDSVDSFRLAEKLNSAAAATGEKIPVLLEINIGGESAKSGLAPDSAELKELIEAALRLPGIEVRGLMTVPPYNEDSEQSRPYFRRMRSLFDQIALRKISCVNLQVLSMGMSHDFEVAIEEGATCIRVGTAIFGERSKPEIKP